MKKLALLLASIFVILPGCSLKKPDNVGKLRIIVDDASSRLQNNLTQLFSMATGYTTLADPSSTSDFNCFAVNITGPGVPGDVKMFSGCTSGDNVHGRGFGIFSKPVVRGVSIEVDVPSGPNRNIDVFGISPPTDECAGGNTAGGSAGYFLGGISKNLSEASSVTIPISFSPASIPGKITCSGSSTPTVYKYFAYAIGGGLIQAMSFDPTTGALVDIGGPAASSSTRISGAQNGNYVYASSGGTQIDIHVINRTTGALSAAGSPTFGASVTNFAVAPNMSFLWGLEASAIYPMAIDNSGQLGAQASFGVSAVSKIAAHPNSRNLYIADTSTVFHYSTNVSTGYLNLESSIATSTFVDIKVADDGLQLYGSTTGTIFAYHLAPSTGNITANVSETLAGSVSSIAVHPSGQFIYAVRGPSNIIQLVTGGGTGTLTADASVYSTGGSNSNFAMVDPTGSYLLVSNNGSSNISVMGINQNTGVLGAASTHAVGFTPTDIFVTKMAQTQ